jgi:thiol-disulfide isomerase/thioredoxin
MSPRVLGRTALGVLTLCAFAIFVTFLNRARPVEQQSGAASLFPLLATTNAAPEFPDGYSWINTEKPLSLRGLRGKVVLLDFWTYGCINCIHILPDLKKLEAKYPSELVVIGVHSAKFQNESDAGNIRNAVMRYNISHPVVVDQNMTIWNSFGVNAWPTFVVIDPNGNIAFMTAGEGNYNALDSQISRLISEARRAGKLSGKSNAAALSGKNSGGRKIAAPFHRRYGSQSHRHQRLRWKCYFNRWKQRTGFKKWRLQPVEF